MLFTKVAETSKRHNPLLEEGNSDCIENYFFNLAERERKGEYFLPYEALAVLLKKKLLDEKNIDQNNVLLIYLKDNDDDEEEMTRKIKLVNRLQKDGDELFITIVEKTTHAFPMYLRNVQGKVKCLIIDADEPIELADADVYETLANTITKNFTLNNQQPDIYVSSIKMQRDYYSCTMLVLKILNHCAKNGEAIFKHLDSQELHQISGLGKNVFEINEESIPAWFLKFAEKRLKKLLQSLSNETINTTVSTKHKLSLSEHFKQNTKTHLRKDLDQGKYFDRLWNTTCIQHMYKCTHTLEVTLRELVEQKYANSLATKPKQKDLKDKKSMKSEESKTEKPIQPHDLHSLIKPVIKLLQK